jgi:hypothetical protein
MKTIASLLILLVIFSCDNNREITGPPNSNPPAEGFNREDSDPKAIAIADSVMYAMGGRESWGNTRFIKWNFFGRRDLLWDKKTGNVRIHVPSDSTVFLVNVQQDTGSVFVNGEEITDKDSLQQLISKAKSIWINDSYWLVMPFKLKDSGVTLKYLRQDTLPSGQQADVLQLTFDDVGVTPQNKYEVYVDRSDNLIKQWAYFAEASQEEPSAVWPWDNYHDIAGLKFSYNRSDNKGPKDVVVYSDVPIEAFNSPDTPDWSAYPQAK